MIGQNYQQTQTTRPYDVMIGQNYDEHDDDKYFALGGGGEFCV
jgi:hypothetical protein